MRARRRTRVPLTEGGDDSALPLLSLLDTLSCGLGAAVLLGLIFSIARSEQPARLGGTEGLLAEFEIQDARALFNVIVLPPWRGSNISDGVELDLRKLEAGQQGFHHDRENSFKYVVYGLSSQGQESLESTKTGRRYIVLHIFDARCGRQELPCPPRWQVGLRYVSRAGELADWQPADTDQEVIVTGNLFVASAVEVEDQQERRFPLSLGQAAAFKPVEIVPVK